jgi:hypothetical protein
MLEGLASAELDSKVTRGVIEHGARLAKGPQSQNELMFGSPRACWTALRGEVTMLEVGDAAPTASPLGAGDAGNGHPAPARKALGSRLRASVAESPDRKRGSQGRKPGARERDDSTGSRDNKSVAEAGRRHLLQARAWRASVAGEQGVAARGGPSP